MGGIPTCQITNLRFHACQFGVSQPYLKNIFFLFLYEKVVLIHSFSIFREKQGSLTYRRQSRHMEGEKRGWKRRIYVFFLFLRAMSSSSASCWLYVNLMEISLARGLVLRYYGVRT